MLASRIQVPLQGVASDHERPAIVLSRAISESNRMSIAAAPERIKARMRTAHIRHKPLLALARSS
jgi:hypothetical protein